MRRNYPRNAAGYPLIHARYSFDDFLYSRDAGKRKGKFERERGQEPETVAPPFEVQGDCSDGWSSSSAARLPFLKPFKVRWLWFSMVSILFAQMYICLKRYISCVLTILVEIASAPCLPNYVPNLLPGEGDSQVSVTCSYREGWKIDKIFKYVIKWIETETSNLIIKVEVYYLVKVHICYLCALQPSKELFNDFKYSNLSYPVLSTAKIILFAQVTICV